MPGIGELPRGPGVAALAIVRCWWQGDIHGLLNHLRQAQQMPALEHEADTPEEGFHRASIRYVAAAGRDSRATFEAYDHVDRSDPLIDADIAWMRLAAADYHPDWAGQRMEAERRVLDHRTSTTGSALFAAMRHHRRAHDAVHQEADYRVAADEARQGLAAALNVGATYFVHFNVQILAQSLSRSGDDAIADLERLAQTLTEQRDLGQVSDQWLLLSGTAGILHRHGHKDLAHDVLRGMLASQWDNRTGAIVALRDVLGVHLDETIDTGPAPEIGDLVDRTLAAIHEVLNNTEPAR
jgi:hypothetical protein